MIGLIPMAGTMTSFGAIKAAIQAAENCTTVENATKNCIPWGDDESAYVGYENLNKTVLSLVASLVFGFTVGSSVITSPIIAKVYSVFSTACTIRRQRAIFTGKSLLLVRSRKNMSMDYRLWY